MAITGGSNPISKHIDDILKDENRKMPAADLPREEKDAPGAGGGDEVEPEDGDGDGEPDDEDSALDDEFDDDDDEPDDEDPATGGKTP